jgi:hypothetical protein
VNSSLASSSAQGSEARSMADRLGGVNGFDQSTAIESAIRILFDDYAPQRQAGIAALLSMHAGWTAELGVRPMKAAEFGKKVYDMIRAAQFQSEIRDKLTDGIARQWQKDRSSREQALNRQLAEVYAVLGRQIEQALEEIKRQGFRLQESRQRRIALLQNERRSLERMQTEIETIQERSDKLTTQLRAVQFRVDPRRAAEGLGLNKNSFLS